MEVSTWKRERPLRSWLDRAEADPVLREDLIDGLRIDLKSLRGNEASAAQVIELLGDRRLADLRDRHGRSVRALAVAALVRMGYPWALQVDQRDLELLREEQRSAEAPVLRWMNAVIALGPFLVTVLGAIGLAVFPTGQLTGALIGVVFLSAAVFLAQLGATFRRHRRRGFRAAALTASAACVAMWLQGLIIAPLDLMLVCSIPAAICALVASAAGFVTPSPIDA
jgi:hypothetical protein